MHCSLRAFGGFSLAHGDEYSKAVAMVEEEFSSLSCSSEIEIERREREREGEGENNIE